VKALARCLDATFRIPSILKFVDFSILAPKLSRVEVCVDDEIFVEQAFKSLSKITTTYQKTLEATFENVELFSAPLDAFSDVGDVRMSVILLESVSGNLSSKDVSVEKKSTSQKIFNRLCQSLEKGIKAVPDSNTSELKFLAIRSLNAVMDAAEGHGESLKKWLKAAAKFVPFCLKVKKYEILFALGRNLQLALEF